MKISSSFSSFIIIRIPALFIPLITLAITFLYPCKSASAIDRKGIPEVISEFAKKHKKYRIAALDFANTEGRKTRFDGYIADTIISELSKYSFVLLERKRLKLVLSEHAISQSGVIDPDKALTMGKFLPVDLIVSGSYTRMGRRIAINGRFIHVVTGEIIYAFSCSIEEAGKGDDAVNGKIDCTSKNTPILNALKNLRDNEKIQNAVNTAIKTPFDNICGKVHFKVMSTFIRNKIFPQKYNQFLKNALPSIADPSGDYRTREIMRYFAADGRVDDDEWKICINAFKKINNYSGQAYLGYMLNNRIEKRPIVRKRIDEIIDLVKKGEIGRPLAISEVDIFFLIFNALKVTYKRDLANSIYVFAKYHTMIPDNDKYNKKAAGLLSTIYFNEKDRKEQKKALKNILTFYKSRATTDLMAGKAADIIKKISGKIDAPKKTDKNKIRAYKEDLKIINVQLADFICTSVAAAKKKRYRYIVADRTEYILRYSIKCEHTPTINDLIADMRSRDWKRKLTAIELLSKIGKAAKGAEATVIKYLGQKGFGTNGGNLRRFCAITLGNIGTTNPQGITRLIESFPDYNRGVSSHAKEAIKKIGIAALPYLIKGLKHKHHAVRYGSAEALGNLGSNAKKAVPALKKIAKNDKDPYVRKQAKGAVQMITNDF